MEKRKNKNKKGRANNNNNSNNNNGRSKFVNKFRDGVSKNDRAVKKSKSLTNKLFDIIIKGDDVENFISSCNKGRDAAAVRNALIEASYSGPTLPRYLVLKIDPDWDIAVHRKPDEDSAGISVICVTPVKPSYRCLRIAKKWAKLDPIEYSHLKLADDFHHHDPEEEGWCPTYCDGQCTCDMEDHSEGLTLLHVAAIYGRSSLFGHLLTIFQSTSMKCGKGNETVLHCASRHGHVDIIVKLIAKQRGTAYPSLDAKNEDGHTATHLAAIYGHTKAFKLLIEKGAALDNVKEVVLDVVKYGRLDVLKWLHHQPSTKPLIDIHGVYGNKNKDSLVEVAVHYDQLDIVNFLLDEGVSYERTKRITASTRDLAIKNLLEFTVERKRFVIAHSLIQHREMDANTCGAPRLFIAAAAGDINAIKLYFDEGDDIEEEADDETALSMAINLGHIEVVQFLLSNGATVPDDIDWTNLPDCAQCPQIIPFVNGYELIDMLQPVNVVQFNGTYRRAKMIHPRMEGDCSVEYDDEEYDSDDDGTITSDVSEGKIEYMNAKEQKAALSSIKDLLKQNTDLTLKKRNWTALQFAVRGGYTAICECLLANGASANGDIDWRRCPEQKNCPLVSSFSKNIDIMQLLQSSEELNAKESESLITTIGKLIKDDGANLHRKDVDGYDILHYAGKNHYMRVVEMLINEGGFDTEKCRWIKMHWACVDGDINKVSELLPTVNWGPDDLNQDIWGWTPLHYACQGGNVEVVKALLIDAGAKGIDIQILEHKLSSVPEFSMVFRLSPLHIACNFGYTDVVKELLKVQQNIYQGSSNTTPLHLAVKEGCMDIVELLLQRYNNSADDDAALFNLDWSKCRVNDKFPRATRLFETFEVMSMLTAIMIDEKELELTVIGHINRTMSWSEIESDESKIMIPVDIKDSSLADKMERCYPLDQVDTVYNEANISRRKQQVDNTIGTLEKYDYADDLKSSMLKYAALLGFNEIAELLLTQGTAVGSDTYWVKCRQGDQWPIVSSYVKGIEALNLFVEGSSDFNLLKTLFDQEGAHVHIVNQNKMSLLHCAAVHSREVGCLQFAIDKGIDVNRQDVRGKTALFYASEWEDDSGVKCLLQNGADINCQEIGDYTVLHYLLKTAFTDYFFVSGLPSSTVNIISTLIDSGIDINRINSQSGTIVLDEMFLCIQNENEDSDEDEICGSNNIVNEAEDDGINRDDNESSCFQKVYVIIEKLFNRGIDLLTTYEGKTRYDYWNIEISKVLSKISLSFESLQRNDYLLWFHLLRSDMFEDRVMAYLSEYTEQARSLAYCRDNNGRPAINIASEKCRAALQSAVFFMNRFNLEEQYEHKSPTCLLFYASDCRADNRQVAVKLMKQKKSYLSELQNRENFDEKHVIPVLHAYDGDSDENFKEQLRLKEFNDYNYCIVMPVASRNLSAVITQENIVEKDFIRIRQIIREVSHCLQHLHMNGIIHGDLKPLNIMRNNEGRYILIDLDACTAIGSPAGRKYSTAYLPPEMFYKDEPDDEGVTRHHPEIKVKQPDSNTNAETRHVMADSSFDVWSLGCVMFHLTSGEPLFLSNGEDNLDQENLRSLHDWTNEFKDMKLSKISDALPRNLVSQMLMRTASERSTLERVLAHPFLSGSTSVTRMVGEAATFDIFLSYRVASDFNNAEKLYKLLTEAGMKVWWDKVELKPGRDWNVLVQASHFIALWSRDAINHPEIARQNIATLNVNSNCDNFYLEHRMALELKSLGLINSITPILIGDIDIEEFFHNHYFNDACHPSADIIPNTFVKAVEYDLKLRMESQALGTPLIVNRSVRSVFEEFSSSQGIFIQGEREQAFAYAVQKICTIVQESCCESPSKKLKANKSTELQDEAEIHIELQNLRMKVAAYEEEIDTLRKLQLDNVSPS